MPYKSENKTQFPVFFSLQMLQNGIDILDFHKFVRNYMPVKVEEQTVKHHV